MKYTNVKHQGNTGEWIDSTSFTGQTVQTTAQQPKVVVGGVQVTFGKSKIRVSKPRTVQSCGTDCAVGTVIESVELAFNVVDSTSLDALKAEVLRVLAFGNTTDMLVHGLIPPAYTNFDDE